MTKTNDPVRVKNAWLRFGAAVLAAVILLAVSGFGIFSLLQGGKTFHTAEDLQVGDYVQDQVDLILANFAEGYHGNTVRELYAVVYMDGQLVAYCFPQRWFASESAIISNTQELLSGLSTDIGHYIQVSGTVKALPERVAAELYDWFGDNQDWMVQLGMIQASDDYADHIPDVMVQVDTVGNLPVGWVVGLSIAAAVCLAYALYELIRILCKGYAAPQAAEPEDADLSDIDVEITESDPETGEDVTDIDVEIIEEAPTEDADA